MTMEVEVVQFNLSRVLRMKRSTCRPGSWWLVVYLFFFIFAVHTIFQFHYLFPNPNLELLALS